MTQGPSAQQVEISEMPERMAAALPMCRTVMDLMALPVSREIMLMQLLSYGLRSSQGNPRSIPTRSTEFRP